MKHSLLIIAALMIASSSIAAEDECSADKPPSRYTGLSVFANAGAIWADRNTADFYSGRPTNANTINRVLHSQTYGQQIWQNLTTAGLISSAVGSYDQLSVVEYPSMYYRTSFQYGLGIRYDYASGFGWLLRFDLARLQALGAFNLSATNETGLLGYDQYVRCGIMGREDRINIEFAITRCVNLTDALDLELDLGGGFVNTKVRDNLMEIAGVSYSILDVWDGRTPDVGVMAYEYINQGGIGYSVFMSALLGYNVTGVGSVRVGYTCYHAKVVLDGYTAWGWQHMIGLRFEMNNFDF